MGLLNKIVKKITKAVGLAPDVQAPEAPTPAPEIVEPPKVEAESDKQSEDTESAKKKVAAGGKKSLTVARASKGGINI
ncbi:host range protein [Morganella phage vB_MmoP_MP2]|uniref:Host range protein n=1 Tax=Morganella phage vB_MmoP_MP2 TaxID=1852627 RepID=A0A192Y9E1_9CAUD|nr:host range protein [Morganella phage vB_MmoP_MP2]ANM46374.1 host range protein [Morganella phage vB_MmoP_MP2]